jgi:beta-lactamase superfamily II metal-dependent hydrolase
VAKRTSTTSRATRSVPAGALLPPEDGVAIRMYRLGLGDCFLLAFSGKQQRPVYMLIDCGVHFAQQDGRANMALVVDDLVKATGGQIDLVVATHEHADHLSGFVHYAEFFLKDQLSIDQVWLAWTEDEHDADAARLRHGSGAAQEAIEAAFQKLEQQTKNGAALTDVQLRLAGATGFFALDADDNTPEQQARYANLAGDIGLGVNGKVSGNELALALLKRRAKQVEYLNAGAPPIAVPGTSAARAYVLGPPRDGALLNRSDPSSGDRHETYLSSAVGLYSFSAAILQGLKDSPDSHEYREITNPFDERYRRSYDWAASQLFFQEHYGVDDSDRDAWRRIDFEWLRAAEELALHLDRHTNNTSLVLAIELGEPGEGPVLLFVGDAQVANWLSWKNLQWRVGNRSLDVADLLRRTQVYKVGHHASHNATLRCDDQGADYGLELMPDGLIALVPVDQAAASKLPGWNMPYTKLYQALKRKTRGNILRSDDGHDKSLVPPRLRPVQVSGVEGATWCCSRAKKADGKPLFYDLMIRPSGI